MMKNTALVAFWSVSMAPRAPRKVRPATYYLAKAVVYALSAVVIFRALGAILGVLFLVLVLLDEATLFRHNLAR